jgi:hypothetical protein
MKALEENWVCTYVYEMSFSFSILKWWLLFLSLWQILVIFLGLSRWMMGQYLKIGHGNVLPSSFLLTTVVVFQPLSSIYNTTPLAERVVFNNISISFLFRYFSVFCPRSSNTVFFYVRFPSFQANFRTINEKFIAFPIDREALTLMK